MGKRDVAVWASMPAPGESEALAAIPDRPIRKAEPGDAGCWVDGSRGTYAITHMIRIACARGWNITDEDFADVVEWENGYAISDASLPERIREIGQDAESWLCAEVAPEGYTFGWNDGSFYLGSEAQWCVWSGGRCYCADPHDEDGKPVR